MNNELLVEKEFLSILVLYPEKVFNLIQIKPNYLFNKANQKVFQAILNLSKNDISVDMAQLSAEVLKYNISLDYLLDIIDDEYVSIYNIEEQFISSQKTILEVYKKKVIKDLSIDLEKKKIDSKAYLTKMSKINEINIKDTTLILTKEELLSNITVEQNYIKFPHFPVLEKTLRPVKGDFITIGASTGVGKSGLLLNLMNELMDDYQCIYFNMEMSKSTISQRIVSIRSGIPVYDLQDLKSDYQKQKMLETIDEIGSKELIIEHTSTSLQEIKSTIIQCKSKEKHTVIFLDHIGLIKCNEFKSLYEQTTEVAKQLRQLCLDFDCTIIAASQLNRASYSADALSLSMLKDSGELENSSSKVILLSKAKQQSQFNPKYTDDMELDVVKNRDGITGTIRYKYDKTRQVFTEVIANETINN